MEEKKNKKPFWKKHIVKLSLLVLLIISIAWGYFGKKSTVSKYTKEIVVLNEKHEVEIKDLKEENLLLLSNTLALAVRSAMINENLSQVDQYLKQTVKMFEVNQILLVNPKNKKIILSTDKKDEDELFPEESILKTQEAELFTINEKTYVASPIMGLNSKLAVMIIQID